MWNLNTVILYALWSLGVAAGLVVGYLLFRFLWLRFNEDARNQAELDKYLKANLSGHEVGTQYERYIGYLFESDGYDVVYHGAMNGYEDLGRDLIVKKDNVTWIVQTKCWAKQKQIHEKHIFQLQGTLEHYKRSERDLSVRAIFYTTATYTKRAVEAAQVLGIELRTEKLDRSYPMIKCNVSFKSNEKIFHLPFDEFYDAIKIKQFKGAFYARTVKEASSQGFRRARKFKKVE
jgi:hypothetical protein